MPITKQKTQVKSTKGQAADAAEAEKPRRRGRPSKSVQDVAGATPMISRDQIIDRAVQLAKVEPLAELSIIGLAREFGVTPALIHYYIGSRDDLISGVVNQYFKARVESLGELTGDWRTDIVHHAVLSFNLMTEQGGVLRYLMSHNRFRLFQQVAPGQTDYGLFYLDRVAQIFRDGGFSAEQTAMGYHLLAQYTMTAAFAQVSHQLPGDHKAFIAKRIAQVPVEQYSAVHYMAQPFTELDSQSAFTAGLDILIGGMERWPRVVPKRASTSRKRSSAG